MVTDDFRRAVQQHLSGLAPMPCPGIWGIDDLTAQQIYNNELNLRLCRTQEPLSSPSQPVLSFDSFTTSTISQPIPTDVLGVGDGCQTVTLSTMGPSQKPPTETKAPANPVP